MRQEKSDIMKFNNLKKILIFITFTLLLLSLPLQAQDTIPPIMLGEVLVTPKNNPAHRIIRQAIANKSQNNFEKYNEYSYRNYLKSVSGVSVMDAGWNDYQ